MHPRAGVRPAVLAGLVSLALWPSVAAAQTPAAVRYGDPVRPPPRPRLAERVEAAVQAMVTPAAAGPGGGAAGALLPDPRLEVALDRLIARLPSGAAPPGGLAEQALWLAGIVEPVPYLMTMVVPPGAEDDVLPQINRVLPAVLAQGRYRRLAVSVAPLGGGSQALVLALQESFVDLAPVPRGLPMAGRALLSGRLRSPYHSPELFVTAPDGKVSQLPAAAGEGGLSFSAWFSCGLRLGAYQVEVAAEDRLGDAVLANFPIHCGVHPPTELTVPAASERGAEGAERASRPPARPAELAAEVEARVLELVNRDRAAAGVAPLLVEPRLSAVARAHSVDMRDRRFFGHISPTTGSALDRLERAGVQAVRVRENLGRAYSAEELERGLMGSPSHRLNILSGDVDRVGIGVAVGALDSASGTHDLYLTQLFARLPEPFDRGRAEAGLRARMAAIRREGGARPVAGDPALDRVARAVAVRLADGTADREPRTADPVERALPSLSSRYRWVRKVSGKALDVSQFGTSPALVDRAVTHAGFAVEAGQSEPGGSVPLWLVVLLAARR